MRVQEPLSYLQGPNGEAARRMPALNNRLLQSRARFMSDHQHFNKYKTGPFHAGSPMNSKLKRHTSVMGFGQPLCGAIGGSQHPHCVRLFA